MSQHLLTKMVQLDSRNQVSHLTKSTWFIHMPVTQRTRYPTWTLLLFVKLLSLEYREAWQKPTYDGHHTSSLEGLYHFKSVVMHSPDDSNMTKFCFNIFGPSHELLRALSHLYWWARYQAILSHLLFLLDQTIRFRSFPALQLKAAGVLWEQRLNKNFRVNFCNWNGSSSVFSSVQRARTQNQAPCFGSHCLYNKTRTSKKSLTPWELSPGFKSDSMRSQVLPLMQSSPLMLFFSPLLNPIITVCKHDPSESPDPLSPQAPTGFPWVTPWRSQAAEVAWNLLPCPPLQTDPTSAVESSNYLSITITGLVSDVPGLSWTTCHLADRHLSLSNLLFL